MFLTISAGSESHEGKPSNDSRRAQRDGRKRTGVKGIKEADVKWQKNMMKDWFITELLFKTS